jgi:DNA polymerase III delta subunit
MLTRQIRQLLTLKSLMSHGIPRNQLANHAGIRPSLLGSLITQSQKFRAQELLTLLNIAARLDIQLKSTKIAPASLLADFILSICHGVPAGTAPQMRTAL